MARLTFSTQEAPLRENETHIKPDRGWFVKVYDNDKNTYDEVISILVLATGCDEEEAYIEAWEIDHLGHSVVHISYEEECRLIAEVIEEIGIRVDVCENL